MDHHNQIHNDVKPQNYLVKFLNGDNDPANIEIVLTDFGLAGADSQGGTPIFASPECLANPGRKDKSSDIFSLGRVFLFMILTKEKFLEFLFVSITNERKTKISELIEKEPFLNLITKMMGLSERCGLQTIQQQLQSMKQFRNESIIIEISNIIEKSTSMYTTQYIEVLKHFS